MRLIKPEIIYEDKEIIVCHKKAGISVQTKKSREQDMESVLRNYRAKNGEEPYIAVVHRLDQPVEGIMVFAKTKRAAASLSAQMSGSEMGQKKAEKYYLAVVCGKPEPERGRLEDYLKKNQIKNTAEIVEKGTEEAKKAVLTYEVLCNREGKSLVKIRLETGRHHQIRVQMASRGFALLGDRKYGAGVFYRNRKADWEQTGERKGRDLETAEPENISLALCAYALRFDHPITGKKMCFSVKPEGEGFSLFSDIKLNL